MSVGRSAAEALRSEPKITVLEDVPASDIPEPPAPPQRQETASATSTAKRVKLTPRDILTSALQEVSLRRLYEGDWEGYGSRDAGIERLRKEFEAYEAFGGSASTTTWCVQSSPLARGDAPYELSDIANGKRLVARFEKDIRYNADSLKWMVFDGDRWRENLTAMETLSKKSAMATWNNRNAVPDPKFAQFAKRSQSASGVASSLKMASSEQSIVVRTDDFDAHPMLLNTPSGTVDLTTGKRSSAKKYHLITKITSAPFDPRAECPRWLKFLDEIFVRGDFTPDHDLVAYIQRLVGYALTGSVDEHVFAVLYGEGRNGKSVFINTVRYVLGEYATTTATDLLMSKRDGTPGHALAVLHGQRFVGCAETDAGRKLDEATVKNITGGDPIAAHKKYGQPFTFNPSHKLFLATNHRPEIKGTDEGIWRRIHCVPFHRVIAPGDVDHGLEAKLRAEAPGILAWGVRGCLDWQAGGLRPPAAVVKSTQDYRKESDAVSRFMEDCCVRLDGAQVPAGKLYVAYQQWAEGEGEQALSSTAFGSDLSSRGFRVESIYSAATGGQVRIRFGIGLLAPRS